MSDWRRMDPEEIIGSGDRVNHVSDCFDTSITACRAIGRTPSSCNVTAWTTRPTPAQIEEYARKAGKAPMHPQPKTNPAKADPVAQAITEAQERVQGLTQLAHDMAELATRKGDVKRLAAKVKEGRAKWMPEGKKTNKAK